MTTDEAIIKAIDNARNDYRAKEVRRHEEGVAGRFMLSSPYSYFTAALTDEDQEEIGFYAGFYRDDNYPLPADDMPVVWDNRLVAQGESPYTQLFRSPYGEDIGQVCIRYNAVGNTALYGFDKDGKVTLYAD